MLAAPVQNDHRRKRSGDPALHAGSLRLVAPAADVGGGDDVQAELVGLLDERGLAVFLLLEDEKEHAGQAR